VTDQVDWTNPAAAFSASPEQATAELARRAGEFHRVEPSTAATDARAAQAALNGLASNAEFANKLLAGDVAAVAEFHRLSGLAAQADATADAIAGIDTPTPTIEIVVGNELPAAATRAAVDQLRDAGFSPKAIEEMFNGKKASRADHEMAKAFQKSRMSDADWTRRLLSGDYTANRELLLCSAVLSAEIEDAI
jgi:hypothetical protein